ncbi:bone morphogenetic protein 1-like [Achroia grisella]|uniref:bone morphogenetic protein 1-like n=1 Tax=Achroia grisella TaxID=688607 RepID=UPI0027D2DA9F|nr:bone morphogenetic protein 1-like [Achroia grisella]
MCPRRNRVLTSPLQNNPALRIIPNIVDDFAIPTKSGEKWAIKRPINDNDNSASNLQSPEPGFDLSEEEMIRLKIWSNGVVPYYIDNLSFDKVLRDRIRSYLEVISGLSGLHFLELPAPPEDKTTRWVFFINRRGQLSCGDNTIKEFTNTGVQKVVLGYDCLSTSGGMAEVILTLAGVPPQHNAPNRNEHITVVTENIIPEKKYLFEAVKDNEWLFHDLKYDFSSAGHYSFHKYTVNGSATIKPNLYVPTLIVGEGDGFSNLDILKIRMLYNYISKKQPNAARVPDCIKIFEPGTNFTSYQTNNDDYMEPRKKPNRFLGLSNDEKEADSNDDNKNNHNEFNQQTHHDDDKENDEYNSNPNIEDEELNQEIKLVHKKNHGSTKNIDILGHLSDYNTDDIRRPVHHKSKIMS